MDIKDVFIGKAHKYNHYEECPQVIKGRRCIKCVRWRFSYPYTCNDMSNWGEEGAKAETCLNYTEDDKCSVD